MSFPRLCDALLPVPPVVSSETPLNEAIAHFYRPASGQAGDGPRCLLILEEERLAGIVTDRDLLRCLAAGRSLADCTVAEAMTHQPVTLKEERLNDLSVLLCLFRYRYIDHLPVIDTQQRPIGTISPSSLCRLLPLKRWLASRAIADVMADLGPDQPPTATVGDVAQCLVASQTSYAVITQAAPSSREGVAIASQSALVDWYARGGDRNQTIATLADARFPSLRPEQTLAEIAATTTIGDPQAHLVTDASGAALGLVTARSILQAFDARDLYAATQQLDRRISHLESLNQRLSAEVERRRAAEQALRASQHSYASLAEGLPVGIFRNDLQGRCIYANHCVAELLGLPTEQVLGTGWREILHPDDRDRVGQAWQVACETYQPFAAEYRFQHPGDRRTIWVFGQVVPERDPEGKIVGFIGSIADITQRKEAEAAAQRLNDELEQRVAQRTADLQHVNQHLQAEITERERIESALWESQEQLQDLFERANDLIQSVNLTTERFIFANRAWHELLGYTPEELSQMSIWQVLHPESYECYRQFLKLLTCKDTCPDNALRHRRIELTFVTKTEQHLRLEGSINCRLTTAGCVTQEFFRDVTVRRRVEQALRESEARYRQIVETAGEGIWALDAEGHTAFANDLMAEMLGTSPTAMVGRTAFDFLDAVGQSIFAQSFACQRLHRASAVERHEIPFLRADGTALWTLVSTTPIVDDEGYHQGTLAMVADISDRRRAEEEILQALARERELNELKSRFIANLAQTGLRPDQLALELTESAVVEDMAIAAQARSTTSAPSA